MATDTTVHTVPEDTDPFTQWESICEDLNIDPDIIYDAALMRKLLNSGKACRSAIRQEELAESKAQKAREKLEKENKLKAKKAIKKKYTAWIRQGVKEGIPLPKNLTARASSDTESDDDRSSSAPRLPPPPPPLAD